MEYLFEIWTKIFTSLTLRYAFIAGMAFLVFYKLFPHTWKHLKIQEKFPKTDDYKREVAYSFFSMVIFSLIALLLHTVLKPYTQLYDDIATFGVPYFFVSLVLMLLIHDTYFYWTHRMMHHPKLYNTMHLVHHKSRNPSPFAAYAFHPTEAVVEVCVLIVIAFVIPVHEGALVLFFLFSIIVNVMGHLGYEIYPKWLIQTPVGRYLNTSVAHNMHHKYNRGNFGFYFTFWDRVMGTYNPNTDRKFDELKARKKKPESVIVHG